MLLSINQSISLDIYSYLNYSYHNKCRDEYFNRPKTTPGPNAYRSEITVDYLRPHTSSYAYNPSSQPSSSSSYLSENDKSLPPSLREPISLHSDYHVKNIPSALFAGNSTLYFPHIEYREKILSTRKPKKSANILVNMSNQDKDKSFPSSPKLSSPMNVINVLGSGGYQPSPKKMNKPLSFNIETDDNIKPKIDKVLSSHELLKDDNMKVVKGEEPVDLDIHGGKHGIHVGINDGILYGNNVDVIRPNTITQPTGTRRQR